MESDAESRGKDAASSVESVSKSVFGKIWAALKFAGRWLGPVLILLAIYFILSPVSPYGDGWSLPAIAGGVVSTIALLAGRKRGWTLVRKLLAACALFGLGLWGFGQWRDSKGYRTEDVSFANRGAKLVGTLYLPDRAKSAVRKVPGVVWSHGAEGIPRGFMSNYVRHYAQSGYAVLIYDKRGVGESTGHFEQEHNTSTENIDLLASDASAAITLLSKRPEVRADRVGFVGGSQAGWIMPRAAVMNGHVAFIVSLSGPATSVHRQMRFEIAHLGENPGNLLQAMLTPPRGRFPAGLTPDQADDMVQRTSKVKFGYADTDPVTDLRALNIPILWMLGDEDWVVPSGPTTKIVDGLRAEGKPFEVHHIPGATHGLSIGPKKLIWDIIDPWLARVTAAQ